MIDPVRHRQLQELDMVELCTRILSGSRNELYLNMHFLDLSLNSLGFEADPSMTGLGTDGALIYYNPDHLCGLYRRGRVYVNRVCSAICTTEKREPAITGTWPAILPWNLSSTDFTKNASMCRRRLSAGTSICA